MSADFLEALGQEIRTQDNRITSHPVFAVQQRVRDCGFESGYSDEAVWHHPDDPERVSAVARPGWTKVRYRDRWEFVTACLTEKGAQAFIDVNGHNLTDPRIYAYSAWRNEEWIGLREVLAALRAKGVEV